MKNLEIANQITKSAINHFGDKLASVLLYGSSLSARRLPKDLDIIIVLKERESPEDLSFLRFERSRYDIEIDLQIINIPDIHPDSFAHDTHGQFVISFLHHAHSIYGENPFLNFFPKYIQRVTSVIQKAQYYYFRAKRLQANDVHPGNQQDFSFHRKKLILMLSDFWLVYSGKVDMLSEPERLTQVISILTNKPPCSGEVNFLLNDSPSFNWGNIFSLYQKYYFAILDTLRPKNKLTISYIGDIYSESHSINSNKLMVIASGCPSDYNETEMIHFLHIRGYDVLTFHYTASGKSKGIKFRLPQEDLLDVVKKYKNHYEQISVIGNSYGGYAALALKNYAHPQINKIIAISPVVDFKKVHSISTLPKYLSDTQPGWYRFQKHEFLNFIEHAPILTNTHPKNTIIIHGALDEQINISDIETYCKNFDAEFINLKKAGHLSLNRLTREKLDVLNDIL